MKVGLLKNLSHRKVLKLPGYRKCLNKDKALMKLMVDKANKRKKNSLQKSNRYRN